MKENTKSLIADTFSQMLDKEDLDKITVTKLIGECHISRQTFYYHFKDIMDVLEWTFRRATEELAQKSLEAESRTEALTAYIAFVSENKRKLEKLIDSRKWAQIEEMLLGSITIYLAEMARNKYSDVDISFDDMEVMLRFYASGITGILLHYIDKPHLNEAKLVKQMEKIITGNMFPGKYN